MAHYHFEMLGLGYAAYLTFRDFCQRVFPGIADQTISKMVAGIDILFFRPDDELRKLSQLALELELAELIEHAVDPAAALQAISGAPNGQVWLEAFEGAKEPWFWFSSGPGLLARASRVDRRPRPAVQRDARVHRQAACGGGHLAAAGVDPQRERADLRRVPRAAGAR